MGSDEGVTGLGHRFDQTIGNGKFAGVARAGQSDQTDESHGYRAVPRGRKRELDDLALR